MDSAFAQQVGGNVAQWAREFDRLSGALENGLKALHAAAGEYAEAENAYRMAKAKAYLSSRGDTVAERQARVDLVTEKERVAAHLAEGQKQALVEAVRARRAQLSALQSLLAAHREEAGIGRYGHN